MSEGAAQEMTLDQWCDQLPSHHRVNIELRALREALVTPASEKPAHEGYNGIAHDVEQAWQMLEVCGVPRERAKNNLARGIEVLSTRLGREEHFQKVMEADAARWRFSLAHGFPTCCFHPPAGKAYWYVRGFDELPACLEWDTPMKAIDAAMEKAK